MENTQHFQAQEMINQFINDLNENKSTMRIVTDNKQAHKGMYFNYISTPNCNIKLTYDVQKNVKDINVRCFKIPVDNIQHFNQQGILFHLKNDYNNHVFLVDMHFQNLKTIDQFYNSDFITQSGNKLDDQERKNIFQYMEKVCNIKLFVEETIALNVQRYTLALYKKENVFKAVIVAFHFANRTYWKGF